MIDITKEEFWDNGYEEVSKKERQNNKIRKLISKHKIITILLISFGILMAINTILIYNFLKVLTEM
jgi:type IV secretory pathway component VirB8